MVLGIILVLVPVTLGAQVEAPTFQMEITGVNASLPPVVTVTATVLDSLGQPVFGLSEANFKIVGDLADRANIVSVENITDDDLSFGVVLAIDTSSSMAGLPLQRAQEAARLFINSIGPNDPVAIVTFDSQVYLTQDFTTDKAALLSAIDNLAFGGKTALYDAGVEGVNRAATSDLPRRAVILLSDGAEYGGRSANSRGAALNEALKRGVPVYTIGLGYGFDRTYLTELSNGTNAKFFESPTPDELLQIYQGLANTLRSQYVITINAQVPGDGQEYPLTIEVTTDENIATATAILRAPIPVPLVSLTDLPAGAISEPVNVTASIIADDAITSAEFQVDGAAAATLTGEPYSFLIDPVLFQPGTHTLTFTAVDNNGDAGTVSGAFEVAALPPLVTITSPFVEGVEITEPVTVTVDASGQTPVTGVTFNLDGGAGENVNAAPFSTTIDPYLLSPGVHTLGVQVTNTGGAAVEESLNFSVAALPPVIQFAGLSGGQILTVTAEITVEILKSQGAVANVVAMVGDVTLTGVTEGAVTTFTANPVELQPGSQPLTITVTDANGQQTSQTVNVVVAALPPEITISGLEMGEELSENRTITVEAGGQTPITNVSYTIDGREVVAQTTAPFSFALDILAFGPGSHVIAITAANTGGQSATVDSAFRVAEGPFMTLTAAAMPTNTPVPTNTPAPTITQPVEATPSEATATLEPTVDVQATADANAALVAEMMTKEAVSQEDAQATVNSQLAATADAQATLDARAAANALATANAQATTDVLAAANAQTTVDAAASLTAQAMVNAQGTADALATTNAAATINAQSVTEEPTDEPTVEATAVPPTDEPTEAPQPNASVTPIGTLTPETVPGEGADTMDIVPIAVVVIGLLVLLLVIFLVLRSRRKSQL